MNFRKLTAAALSCLIFGQAGLAESSQSVIWNERPRARAATILAALPAVAPFAPSAPAAVARPAGMAGIGPDTSLSALNPAYGTVRGVRLPGKSARGTAVLIQDVHLNPEAQDNIRRAVQDLVSSGVGAVALEGAIGPLPVGPLRATIDRTDLAAVTAFLVREGRVSGAAAAVITAATDAVADGIDDPNLYAANLNAYLNSRLTHQELRSRLNSSRASLAALKEATFSPELLEYDAEVEAYRGGRRTFGDYIDGLAGRSETVPESIRLFSEAFSIERRLDFSSVEVERRRAFEMVSTRASRDDMSRLLSAAVAFRAGRITSAQFHGDFSEICRRAGVSPDSHGSLSRYLRYLELSDRIDAERLLSDARAVERSIYDNLSRTPAERALVRDDRWFRLAARLADFSLSAEEWHEFAALPRPAIAPPKELTSAHESFYRTAISRDAAMAARAIARLRSASGRTIAVVAGGFHSPGIRSRLLDSGVAVVDFTPRLTRSSDGSAYLSAFAREHTPLEKLFAGDRLFLASHPLPRDVSSGLIPAAAMARAWLQGRAPPDPLKFIGSASPGSGVTSATVRRDGSGAAVRLERRDRAADVLVTLAPDGTVETIRETDVHTGTYAIGRRLFGRFSGWKRLSETVLAWLVELPAVIRATLSRSSFDAFVRDHPGRRADVRTALSRLVLLSRAGGLGVAALTYVAVLAAGHPGPAAAIVPALTAGAVSTVSVALLGHLAQNLLGVPLTTGRSGRGPPRLIPDARVFEAAGDDVVIPVRFELDPVSALAPQADVIGETVLDLVARRQTEGVLQRGRTMIFPLDEPVMVDGVTLDVVVLKRVGYRGRPPSTDRWTDDESEDIQQPTEILRTSHGGAIFLSPLVPRVTGTSRLIDNVTEYREMRRAFRAGVRTGFPIGIGEFPSLAVDGETMGFIAYLDDSANLPRVGTSVRERTGRLRTASQDDFAALTLDAIRYLDDGVKAAAATLRDLHEAGQVHRSPHTDQFGYSGHDRAALYDFDDVAWIGRMTRDEYVFWRINDLLQLYHAVNRLANRVNPTGSAVDYYEFFLPEFVGAPNPLQDLVASYFTPTEIEAIGWERIWSVFRPRDGSKMPFNRFWRHFGDKPTSVGALDRDIWSIAEEIGGRAYDRIIEERVLAPLAARGIPSDRVRPHLRALHETALERNRLEARDVEPLLAGVGLGRGDADTVAAAVSAFAEIPHASRPTLVLPLTTRLVAFLHRRIHPFSAHLAGGTPLPADRPWVRAALTGLRRAADLLSSPVRKQGTEADRHLPSLEELYSRWRTSPWTSREHADAVDRMTATLTRLPPGSHGVDIREMFITRWIRLLRHGEPHETAELVRMIGGAASTLPADAAGRAARRRLTARALPLLDTSDTLLAHRAVDVLDSLLGDRPDPGSAGRVLSRLAPALGARDHGLAIRASVLARRIVEHVPSGAAALQSLAPHAREIGQKRFVPVLTGGVRERFGELHELAERGRNLRMHRAMWLRDSRDAADAFLSGRWARAFVAPFLEIPGLPGIALAVFAAAAPLSLTAAAVVAPTLAGVIFAALHGRPGRSQSKRAFLARAAAATAINAAAIGLFVSVPGAWGVTAAFAAAYAGHGAWNLAAPRRWALTLEDDYQRLRAALKRLDDRETSVDATHEIDEIIQHHTRGRERRRLLRLMMQAYTEGSAEARSILPYLLARFVSYYPRSTQDHVMVRTAFMMVARNPDIPEDDREMALRWAVQVSLDSTGLRRDMDSLADEIFLLLRDERAPALVTEAHGALQQVARHVTHVPTRLRIVREGIAAMASHDSESASDSARALAPLYATFPRPADRRAILDEAAGRLIEWERAFALNPETVADLGSMVFSWISLPRGRYDLTADSRNRIADHVVRFYPRLGSLYFSFARYLVGLQAITPSEHGRLQYAHWDLHPSHLDRTPITILESETGAIFNVLGRLRMRSEGLSLVQRPEWQILFADPDSDRYVESLPSNYQDISVVVEQDGRSIHYYPARLIDGREYGDVMLLLGEPARRTAEASHDVAATEEGTARREWIPWRTGSHTFLRPAVPIGGVPSGPTRRVESGVVPFAVTSDGKRAVYLFTETGVLFDAPVDHDLIAGNDREFADYRALLGGHEGILESQAELRNHAAMIDELKRRFDDMSERDRILYVIDLTQDAVDAIRAEIKRDRRELLRTVFDDIPADDFTTAIVRQELEDFFTSHRALDPDTVAYLTDVVSRHTHGLYVPNLNVILSDEGVEHLVEMAARLIRTPRYRPQPATADQAATAVIAAIDTGHPVPGVSAERVIRWISHPAVVARHQVDQLERLAMSRVQRILATVATLVRAQVATIPGVGPILHFVMDDSFHDASHQLGNIMHLATPLFSPKIKEVRPLPTYVEITLADGRERRVFAAAAEGSGTAGDAVDSISAAAGIGRASVHRIVRLRPDAADVAVPFEYRISSGDSLRIELKPDTGGPEPAGDGPGSVRHAPGDGPTESSPPPVKKGRGPDIGERRRTDGPMSAQAETRVASAVLDALQMILDAPDNPSTLADRLESVIDGRELNLDLSSADGRMGLFGAQDALDPDLLDRSLILELRRRGRRFSMEDARRGLQILANAGVAGVDLDTALVDDDSSRAAADIAIVPASMPAATEARLMAILSDRRARRGDGGRSVVIASGAGQAARLRALSRRRVLVVESADVISSSPAGPTVDLALAVRAIRRNGLDLNTFTAVNLIAPAGHTLLADGLGVDVPWVRRAAILLIDDLLRSVRTTLPAVFLIERTARLVSSQA